MADSKKYNGSTWEHSLRKLTTATDTFTTLPVDIYADGNNATVGLKGNTVQSGTPTPDNPIMPQGCGEMTENLLDKTEFTGVSATIEQIEDGIRVSGSYAAKIILDVLPNTDYHLSYVYKNISGGVNRVAVFAGTGTTPVIVTFYSDGGTFNTNDNTKINIWFYASTGTTGTVEYTNIMLNTGSTALPYEPYGQYKIPISSGGVTTNIYLGSTQTVRQIYKYVLTGDETWTMGGGATPYPYIAKANLPYPHASASPLLCTHFLNNDSGMINGGGYALLTAGYAATGATDLTTWKAWLAQQYANGAPVIVWYILETPETAAVNEPLMKIGDYADTLSNAASIPTTEGANSITVDTAVQPSEFTATWTGWHNAEVKEWDGSDWQ